MLRLTTVGRRTGEERVAIVGYIEDGPNLVIPAMNGWADPEPAWWLNLQANPNATVELPDGPPRGHGPCRDRRGTRPALGGLPRPGSSAYTDASAALRSRETAIVVLEPRLD